MSYLKRMFANEHNKTVSLRKNIAET